MNDVLRLPLTISLLLYQSVVLAWSQILGNKVRGILTTLGILIGVAAVSAVIALMAGMKAWVLHEFEALGANRIIIYASFPPSAVSRPAYWKHIFKPRMFDGLRASCPSLAKYSRVDEWGGDVLTFRSKVEDTNVSIYGVDAAWHEVEHRGVSVGRTISAMDNALRRPVCLINTIVRDKLEMDRNPVGQYLTVEGMRVLVVGLLEPAPVAMGLDADRREVVVPFDWLVERDPWPGFAVFGTSIQREQSEDAKAEIEFYMRQVRGVKVGHEDDFTVMTDQRVMEQFDRTSATVTLVAVGIVGISLLVGGIGIMNIMLVSVSERTREIGLRKAVGARPAAILLQFLVEAVVLCLLGGVLGLIAGQALTTSVTALLPPEIDLRRLTIPPSAVALAFAFCATVGVVFGMFPAIKAARLQPIEALRHE